MKQVLFPFFVTLLLFSCHSSSNNSVKDEIVKEKVIITYSSELNPNKTDWDLNEVYTDTLEFLEFDDNYDYPYALFRIKDNLTTRFVFDGEIDKRLEHGIFEVQWKIDSLYEAGENEELYYGQRMLNFKIIEKPIYFGDFLVDFLDDYAVADSGQSVQKYLNDKIGFYSTFKPGLYCVIQDSVQPTTGLQLSDDYQILNETLLGNFCDGYPNIQDGLYFESIEFDNIPWFEVPTNEHIEEVTFPLNSDYCHNNFKRVTIVIDEQHIRQLYFIELDKQWYLWAEDNCGCEA